MPRSFVVVGAGLAGPTAASLRQDGFDKGHHAHRGRAAPAI